jgi:hypothetical protein
MLVLLLSQNEYANFERYVSYALFRSIFTFIRLCELFVRAAACQSFGF